MWFSWQSACLKALGLTPQHGMGLAICTCNPNTRETKAGGSEVQDLPRLCRDFEARRGYIRHCLNQTKQANKTTRSGQLKKGSLGKTKQSHENSGALLKSRCSAYTTNDLCACVQYWELNLGLGGLPLSYIPTPALHPVLPC